MHLVQQSRQSLYFVHDHPAAGWNSAQFVCEVLGMRQKPLVSLFRQQIDHMGIGESSFKPRALAGSAWTHKKKILFRGLKYSFENYLITSSSFFNEK
jgi:hypothetical protein